MLGSTWQIGEDGVAACAARYGERRRVGEVSGAFLDRAIRQEVAELTSSESTTTVARPLDRGAADVSLERHGFLR